MKYEGYLEKEQQLVEKMNRLENFVIPDTFDYTLVKSISLEAREKLKKQNIKGLILDLRDNGGGSLQVVVS